MAKRKVIKVPAKAPEQPQMGNADPLAAIISAFADITFAVFTGISILSLTYSVKSCTTHVIGKR